MTLKTTILKRGPKSCVCVYSAIVSRHFMQAWQVLVMTQFELCHYSYDFTISPNIWSTASLCLRFVFLSHRYLLEFCFFFFCHLDYSKAKRLEEQGGLSDNLIGKQLKWRVADLSLNSHAIGSCNICLLLGRASFRFSCGRFMLRLT